MSNTTEQKKFSEWNAMQSDDWSSAGIGYSNLSNHSKKMIDYAVDRYVKYLKSFDPKEGEKDDLT